MWGAVYTLCPRFDTGQETGDGRRTSARRRYGLAGGPSTCACRAGLISSCQSCLRTGATTSACRFQGRCGGERSLCPTFDARH